MECLMQNDSLTFLTQQVFLHLPLPDLLECKYVCRLWWAHMEELLKNDSTKWSNAHVAKKMLAATSSVVGRGTVVQEVHLNALYKQLLRRNYSLHRCQLHKGLILIMFIKIKQLQHKEKYVFCVLPQHNVHKVVYVKKFSGSYGGYYFDSPSSTSTVVVWWYIREGGDNLQLNFAVLTNPPRFSEEFHTVTLPSSHFVSPVIALHEIRSGDASLRVEITTRFPGLDYRKATSTSPGAVAVYRRGGGGWIFYHTRPRNEPTELWVLDKSITRVRIRRSHCRRDWTCKNSRDLPSIDLQYYRKSMAIFYIKPCRSFAVWDLSRPGHPRHIGLNVNLSFKHWNRVVSYVNRSNWVIGVHMYYENYYIYVGLPSERNLSNSLAGCECSSSSAPGDRKCLLEESKLSVTATMSSHTPELFVLNLLDRYIIEKAYWSSKELYIRDSWKPKNEVNHCSFTKGSFKAISLQITKVVEHLKHIYWIS